MVLMLLLEKLIKKMTMIRLGLKNIKYSVRKKSDINKFRYLMFES